MLAKTMAKTTLMAILAVVFVVGLAAAASGQQQEQQCVWYGRCGKDPKYGDDRHILNCLNRGPAKRAPAEDAAKMRDVCPHFAQEFEDEDGNLDLCCDTGQGRRNSPNFVFEKSFFSD
jgi:hypothetical protein